jgi:transketolase
LDGCRAVVTIEEHGAQGGIGSAVAEAMADAGIVRPLRRFAIADHLLYAYGDRDALHEERGLDAGHVTDGVVEWLAAFHA